MFGCVINETKTIGYAVYGVIFYLASFCCCLRFRSKMDEFEAKDGRILGSLLLEPVLMGAGGMIFVDPLFQRVLVQVLCTSEYAISYMKWKWRNQTPPSYLPPTCSS